ncbi:MAG: hypothetical protein RLZZ136_1337 [Pseudomonadota bacterium]|jgi:predicted PurR-regulated permease PerM
MTKRLLEKFGVEEGGFFVLVTLITLAFAWLMAPYFGAILWAVVLVIVCQPVHDWLCSRIKGHGNLAASLTLLFIVVVAVFPAIFLGASLISEASRFYDQLQANTIDLALLIRNLQRALPNWASHAVATYGLADLDAIRDMLRTGLAAALNQVASKAFVFGQGALRWVASLSVMLYLTYFLLRDGKQLRSQIGEVIPLRAALRDSLLGHFATVIRATMKGTVVVAIVQGTLGGMIFWALGIEGALLWGLFMGFFSMIPAVGTGIIWVPVSAYLLLSGSILEGGILVFCGLFVIGVVDNFLRPFLVGKDTRMPDFVVLIATLAGLELFGLNGFIMGPVIAALFIAVWKSVGEWRLQSAA